MGLFSKNGKNGQASNGAAHEPTPTPAPAPAPVAARPPQPQAQAQAAPANAAPAGKPDPKAAQEALTRSRRAHASLGEVVSVLMRSPFHAKLTLEQVQAIAAPAIATRQFMVANTHDPATGMAGPIATIMWANVSDEIDAKLSDAATEAPFPLKPADWRSGENAWVVAVAGDQRAAGQLLRVLHGRTLKGRKIKTRIRSADGKFTVRTLDAAPAPVEAMA